MSVLDDLRYGGRRLLKSNGSQLVVIALIALSIPIALNLAKNFLQFRTQAVVDPAHIYIEPSSLSLPPNASLSLMADVKTNQIGFLDTKLIFDPAKIQLTSEIETNSALATIVEKTSLNDANTSGIINLTLALPPQTTPLTGQFRVATLAIKTMTTNSNDTTNITVEGPESQVVDMTASPLPITTANANLSLNPTSSLPSTTVTPALTAAISPITTSTPTPTTPTIPTSNILEAEAMTFTSNAISKISDASASGGQGLIFYSNSSATGNITTPSNTTQVVVTARGDSCKGNARMNVNVDGVTVMKNKAVGQGAYANYSASVNKNAGSHSISVSFVNDLTDGCDRNLRVDKITLQ